MTKSSWTKVRATARGYKAINLNATEQRLYRVLNILKRREIPTMPIFYPNPKYFREGSGESIHSLVKVEKNLFSGRYATRPWNFIRDVNKSFEFIKQQHSKKTKIFSVVEEFQRIFSAQMDNLMQEMGYCCGHWYILAPRTIVCNGNGVKGCTIQEETLYYRFREWTYCHICFVAFKDDLVKLDPEVIVPKSQFSEYFFAGPKVEDFVHCRMCKKKNHEICVLYYRVSGQPFFCQQCRELKNIEKIPMRAEMLPKTECDIFIDNFLKYHNINKDSTLVIRLLSDMENLLNVKNNIQEFRHGQDKYLFRNCTLFTFFDTGVGADICFFAVFFQLYGSDCDAPNRNTAYISYIDSVNLLPSSSRTKIYWMILLGLFEFLKKKGYLKIYLWSCPPTQNQDYIFYMKPPKMKMPTKDRLSKWYVDLFKLGKELCVIDSYVGIHEHANAEKWESITDIPYLDGDLWIARIDEAVTSVNRETTKLQSETVNLRLRFEEARKKSNDETKKMKEMQGRLAKKITAVKENDKRANLWKMINVQIRGFSSEYFVIHLSIPTGATTEEAEPSETIKRIWLNDRSALVDFFWEFMLEFSSERRAQFSTYVMLYRIFAESCFCIGCSKVSAAGVTGALLCEVCHKKDSWAIPRRLEIPSEYLTFNLTPHVSVKRCRITSMVQSDHSYAMNLHSSGEEWETPSTSFQSQRESRESSVTTDSGFEKSPSTVHGSQPEDDEICAKLSDCSDVLLFEDSDDDLCHQSQQPQRQKRTRTKVKHQNTSGMHYTRSMDPVKKFDKPRVVDIITLD